MASERKDLDLDMLWACDSDADTASSYESYMRDEDRKPVWHTEDEGFEARRTGLHVRLEAHASNHHNCQNHPLATVPGATPSGHGTFDVHLLLHSDYRCRWCGTKATRIRNSNKACAVPGHIKALRLELFGCVFWMHLVYRDGTEMSTDAAAVSCKRVTLDSLPREIASCTLTVVPR